MWPTKSGAREPNNSYSEEELFRAVPCIPSRPIFRAGFLHRAASVKRADAAPGAEGPSPAAQREAVRVRRDQNLGEEAGPAILRGVSRPGSGLPRRYLRTLHPERNHQVPKRAHGTIATAHAAPYRWDIRAPDAAEVARGLRPHRGPTVRLPCLHLRRCRDRGTRGVEPAKRRRTILGSIAEHARSVPGLTRTRVRPCFRSF